MDAKMIGLTAQQAKQLGEQGKANIMPKSKEGGVGEILYRNIFTLFNLLNLALAVLLLIVGSYRNMLFLGVAISNILIGTIQELRAKKTHDRLKLLSEGKVTVIRDGREISLMPSELVLGDVTRLLRGDQVPADAKVLSGRAHVDESLLTGESRAVEKMQDDELFAGSFLLEGNVVAELTAIGAQSYAGKLQLSARKVKRSSSVLMRDMQRIIRIVSIAIVPLALLLFWKTHGGLDVEIEDAVIKCVAAVLGMIPEGLILLTSIALAAGVVRLGKRKALVNELYGIESLARTSVVCVDKTGTLTNGEMTFDVMILQGTAKRAQAEECLAALLSTFYDQTPTNIALHQVCPEILTNREALQTVPFSSERKWSGARFEGLGTVVLGAPECLLAGAALEEAKAHAAQGLRVLALMSGDEPFSGDVLPSHLQPMALICLRDTLRPLVRETVRYFGEQGVCLKVLSGDHPLTVSHVAHDAGIPNAQAYVDVSALPSPIDYAAIAKEYTVFGRVSPNDKRFLIEAMQAQGDNVAMVGDGVNDIPALKAADCSIAMACGSDAVCRIAQITLLNSDFEVMPEIVLEGRRVINNITRASSLFLVKNIFSFILTILLLLLPFIYPFMPIQLTLVSTLTVGIPSFVLALQPNKERVQGNFLRNVVTRALPGGLSVAFLTIGAMVMGAVHQLPEEVTSMLCTLIAGYSGMVVLVLTCLPLDWLRFVLILFMAGIFLFLVVLCPSVFYFLPIEGIQWHVLLGAAVLAPILQLGLAAIIRRFRHPRRSVE